MAKLLKPKKHKVSPKRVIKEDKKIVLVGTYKTGQLEKWPGFYNYPICDGDKIELEFAKKVNEIWLFNAKKEPICLKAEFIGFKTRDELRTEYGYPATGKPHGTGSYILYSTSKTQIYNPASGLAEKVIVRLTDFATSKSVQKKLRDYLASPDRKDPLLANCLPPLLTKLPPEVLRVCDPMVQMDFFYTLDDADKIMAKLKHRKVGDTTLRFIDLFAGIGGVRKGFELACADRGLKTQCVFTSEIKPHAIEVLKQNHPDEYIHGDITKVNENEIPDFDVLLGGFPCQAFSAAGKRLGFEDTRGTLFFDVARILKAKKPLGFVLENVEGLVYHESEMEAA